MPTLNLKPAAGLRVIDPDTGQPLPAAGAEVPDTSYWRRRIEDGDAVPAARAGTPEEA